MLFNSNITLPLRILLQRNLSSHPYNNFTIYLPSNLLFLNSFTFGFNFIFLILSISSCCLTFVLVLPLNSSTSSLAFSRSFSFSHILFFIINPFHLTRYFSIPLIFLLFNIFSTFHSSTSSTSTGFGSSAFCLLTCSLYFTTLLMFTTG